MTRSILLIPLLSAFLTPGSLWAQEGSQWLLVQGAALRQSRHPLLSNGTGCGLAFGAWCTPRWGFEASTFTTDLEARDFKVRRGETHLDLSALWNPFPDAGAWTPFLRLGLGASGLDRPTTGEPANGGSGPTWRLNLHGGLGLQAHNGPWMASAELRSVAIRTTFPRTETQALLGLGLCWGVPAHGRQEKP